MTTAIELDVFSCELDGINQIEASAGTGKTWNICGLYLRLLLQRALQVQQILVVTFTNAATAELRERIRSRIVDTQRALQSDELKITAKTGDPFVTALIATTRQMGIENGVMLQRLDLALQTFDEAAIYTIHGFCQRALADAPFAVGMPFATELLADDRDFLLRATQDFWRQRIGNGAAGIELIKFLAAKKDDPQVFANLLQRHIKKSQSSTLWPEQIDAPFISCQDDLQSAFGIAKTIWLAHAEEIKTLLLESADALNQTVYKPDLIHTACAQWHDYFNFDEQNFGSARSATSHKRGLMSVQTLETKTKKNKQTPTHVFFNAADTLLTLEQKADADLTQARLRLLRDMLRDCTIALQQAKREQRVQSYDDILLNVFTALTSDTSHSLASRLQQTYPAALIDEFQDTDPLQFAIFSRIYGANDGVDSDPGTAPLFFVGDPKQAIYSFRNADLYTYLRARQSATAQYRLADNQRSSEALIAAQNALFGANPNAFILPDLHYEPVHFGKKPRIPFIDTSEPRSALQVWALHDAAEINNDAAAPNLLDYATARRLTVQATAAEIARLLSAADQGQIHLGERALRAGDIAVLVKSHAQGKLIRQALAALRVGCVELSQASIFDSADAAELAQVLQAINEPARTGLLLGALATELFGHDAARIAAIATDELALQAQIDLLMQYRRLWRERGVGLMFRRLLREQRVAARLLQRADGERRMTNVLHLGELLFEAASKHPAPDALMRWLSVQRSETRLDDATQLRLESDQNLVQIVTIHRSKGLEYPIVFCPFLWQGRTAAGGDRIEGYEYHDDDQQIVIDLRPDPPELDHIKQKIKEDQAAEFIRLMYVALTRAAHRCYLVAGCYSTNTFGRPSTSEGCRSLLNWLVAGKDMQYADWGNAKLTPLEIASAWRNLAHNHPAALSLSAIPTTIGHAMTPPRITAASLVAQTLPQSIRPAWRMTSFSALQQATQRAHIGRDHDVRPNIAYVARSLPTAAISPDDIVRFPRGPGAGDTLHAILEKIDFSDPSEWSRIIRNGLLAYPQTLADTLPAQQLARQEKMVHQMLVHLTQTELTSQVHLTDVTRDRSLAELEFNLPAPEIDAPRFNLLLQQAGYRIPPLDFKRISGYLKGFIDLVFEAHGRFYLLDWKSNYLGAQAADYGRAQIDQAMTEHGYHLQSLLYAVALHRYLQTRLAGYDYGTHFGGVLYLFIRGVRPHWTTKDGEPSGVYFHKPASATIEQLDQLFSNRADGETV